jgi:GrpB protein
MWAPPQSRTLTAIREPRLRSRRGLRHTDLLCNLHVFGFDSPEPVKHRIFHDWLRGNAEERDRYAAAKHQAADDANAAESTYAKSAEVDKDFAELEALVGQLKQDKAEAAAARPRKDEARQRAETAEDPGTPRQHADAPAPKSKTTLRLALVGRPQVYLTPMRGTYRMRPRDRLSSS